MKRPQLTRARLTIGGLMVLVAVMAGALAIMKAKRDAEFRVRLERLRADLDRAEARVKWSSMMLKKGYVRPATAKADQLTLDKVKAEIDQFGKP